MAEAVSTPAAGTSAAVAAPAVAAPAVAASGPEPVVRNFDGSDADFEKVRAATSGPCMLLSVSAAPQAA